MFGAEGESARNWEEVLKNLRRRGVKRVRIFVTDDLPVLEEAIRKIFPKADGQLCVLHAMQDAPNQARKKDQEALPKTSGLLPGRNGRGRQEVLKRLRERWGTVYLHTVARWEVKAYALLAFLRHPKPIHCYLYTTNQPERLAKE
ncbi:MAG: transposase [Candidatus Methanomethyliaceae archaeon]